MNVSAQLADTLPPSATSEDFPSCCCPVSVPWLRRRLDLGMREGHETRTCLTCGATKTIAHCEHADARQPERCGRRAHWTVTPSRYGSAEYYVCENHARDAIHYGYGTVEDVNGCTVDVDGDGNLVPRVHCRCGDGSCMLCDDNGMVSR